MHVSFPSSELPPYPAVSVDAPESWETDWVSGALFVVFDPDSTEGFRTNAIVTHERFPAGVALEDVAQAAFETQVADAASVDLVDGRLLESPTEGRRIVRMLAVAQDEGTLPLFQMEVFAEPPRDGGPFVDVVVLTATCPASEAESRSEEFARLLETLSIVPSTI